MAVPRTSTRRRRLQTTVEREEGNFRLSSEQKKVRRVGFRGLGIRFFDSSFLLGTYRGSSCLTSWTVQEVP